MNLTTRLRNIALIGLVMSCHADATMTAQPTEHAAMPHQTESSNARVDKSSDYYKYWPDGQPALFKLKDNLILAIPPQYQKFWYQKDKVVRAPAQKNQIPQVTLIGFQFFMPNFSGYTPQNYKNDFDENMVDVVSIESADPSQAAPGAPGEYPPNMLKRALASFLNPNDYQDMYGLRCYQGNGPNGSLSRTQITCYGRRDDVNNEDIMLDAMTPPYRPGIRFPIMQASYFSNRCGGMHLVWRTHTKNLPRWHEIDTQIWKFIDAWNIADSNDVKVAP